MPTKKIPTLVLLLSAHRDELEADFQQFYGLDLGGMGSDFSVAHAAALASQLPQESRSMCALNPDYSWSNEMNVLVRIDYFLQVLIRALAGKRGMQKPKPIQTPRESRAFQQKFDNAEAEMEEISRLLGIGE